MHDGLRRHITMVTVLGSLLFGVPAAFADCTAPTSLLPLCLDGTTIAGDYKSAIVEQPGQSNQTQVQVDDTVLSWRVTDIGPKYVKLSKDGTTVEVDLQADKVLASNIKQGPMKHMHSLDARGERESAP
jgi:hypothetical protein